MRVGPENCSVLESFSLPLAWSAAPLTGGQGTVPIDDEGYTRCFEVEQHEEWALFLKEYGFVCLRILSTAEVDESVGNMLRCLCCYSSSLSVLFGGHEHKKRRPCCDQGECSLFVVVFVLRWLEVDDPTSW